MAIFFGCQCWHMGKSLLQNFPHKQNEFNISSACTDLREPCDRIDTKRANDLKKCWNYFRMIDTSLWPNLSKLILRSWIYSHKELFSRSFYHQIGFAKVLSQNKIHPFLINSRIHYWCLRPVSNWYHHFQCKSQFAIKTGQFHPMGIWLDFSTRGLQVFRIRATALNLFKWATSAVSGSIFTIFITRFKMWIKKLFTFWQIIVWILKVCASRQTNIVSPKLNLKSVSINLNCKYLDHRDHLIKSKFFF